MKFVPYLCNREVTCRAFARILKLPIILKRVPVKKIDAVGERVKLSTQYHASHHGWSPGDHLRAPGGV